MNSIILTRQYGCSALKLKTQKINQDKPTYFAHTQTTYRLAIYTDVFHQEDAGASPAHWLLPPRKRHTNLIQTPSAPGHRQRTNRMRQPTGWTGSGTGWVRHMLRGKPSPLRTSSKLPAWHRYQCTYSRGSMLCHHHTLLIQQPSAHLTRPCQPTTAKG